MFIEIYETRVSHSIHCAFQVSVVYFAVRQPRLDIVADSSRLESLISLCGKL